MTLLLITNVSEARSFQYREPIQLYMGLGIGPVIGWNEDFNGENTQSTTGFSISAEVINSLNCSFCNNLMLESSIGYEHLGSYTFKPVTARKSRIVGTFRESVYILHGNSGLRYYPIKGHRFSPFISFTPGLYYSKVRSASFKDITGNDVDFGGLSRSSLNVGFGIGAGLSYQLSHKIILEFYPKWHVFFPQGPSNSFIQLPLTFKYRF